MPVLVTGKPLLSGAGSLVGRSALMGAGVSPPAVKNEAIHGAVAFSETIDTSGPFLPDQVYAAFEAEIRAAIARWLDQAVAAARDATTLDALQMTLLELHAETRLEPLAALGRDAFALAHLTGRASVIDEANTMGVAFSDDAAARGIEFDGGPFEEAVSFLRQKVALPQNDWQELMHAGHDRAFVVAGIASQEVAEDIQTLVVRNMEQGGLAGFRKDLDALIEDGRWTGRPEMVIDGSEDAETLAAKQKYKAWRTRTIYDTNLRTAHAAGRLKQQRALVDILPFFQYMHAATRTPKRPRAKHVRLDGLTLPQDDPVWQRIYAPNGWLCSCAVMAVTQSIADEAPDNLRQAPVESVINAAVPPEWQYLPGDTWERGLVPSEQAGLLEPSRERRAVQSDLPALETLAAPMRLPEPLPQTATDEEIAARFLSQFGASLERGVLYRDVAGQQLVVSRQLLEDGKGNLKVRKRGRDAYMDRLAAALLDPDEIWVDWAFDQKAGSSRLERTYLRYDEDAQLVTGFVWSRKGWAGTTAMHRTDKKGDPDKKALERKRHGALLYRRQK